MKCKYLKLLSRYVDNELSLDDKALMEKHLVDCPVCIRELEIMNTLKQNIPHKKIESNPEFFWQQLKSRIAQEEKERLPQAVFDFGNWAKRLIPVPVAIGIIAIILLNIIPEYKNPVDEYVFGSSNGSVLELIEEPGNQSILGG